MTGSNIFANGKNDIGYDPTLLGNYNFETKLAICTALKSNSATLRASANGNA